MTEASSSGCASRPIGSGNRRCQLVGPLWRIGVATGPGATPLTRMSNPMTSRETDVLEHLVRGESNADIARALVVSEGTVKFHVKNILRKLNASNRAEATSRYFAARS